MHDKIIIMLIICEIFMHLSKSFFHPPMHIIIIIVAYFKNVLYEIMCMHYNIYDREKHIHVFKLICLFRSYSIHISADMYIAIVLDPLIFFIKLVIKIPAGRYGIYMLVYIVPAGIIL